MYVLREPFLLRPAAKDYLWGGNRLNDDFGKGIDMSPLAETWECSTHPDGPSTIASGRFAGELLSDFIGRYPAVLGTHPRKLVPEGLPVLIKFIDAKKDLSVQVHPDDDYAREHERGSLGKTEMWYVLSAAPGASLVYGFHHDMDKATLREKLEDGTVEHYLQKVPVKKDDIFLIKAGTVHAIGAGALIAEIQESSNLTYRLYDYNRVGKDGKKRELHIEKALAVANLKAMAVPKQPMRVLKYRPGWASELLCRCKYFEVERVLLNTEITRQLVSMRAAENSFKVLLCTDGCGSISFGCDDAHRGCAGTILNFFKGDCIFIPADSVEVKLHGKAQMLMVTC